MECSGSVIRASDPQSTEHLLESCATLLNLWHISHSMLLQFTQLYEWVPGYRQWWIFTYKQSLCINYSVAECFREKFKCWSTEQVGKGLDIARYKNVTLLLQLQ